MTPTELRAILDSLGLTQTGAAPILGVSPRAIRAWTSGFRNIPEPLAKLLRLLASGAVTVDQVRDA